MVLVTRKSGGRHWESRKVKNKISKRGRVTEGSKDESQKENICRHLQELTGEGEGNWEEHIFFFPFSYTWHGFDILPFFSNIHNSRLLICGDELHFLNWRSLSRCYHSPTPSVLCPCFCLKVQLVFGPHVPGMLGNTLWPHLAALPWYDAIFDYFT